MEAYLFADDLLVVAKNEKELKITLQFLENISLELRIVINKSKSGILVVTNSWRSRQRFKGQ